MRMAETGKLFFLLGLINLHAKQIRFSWIQFEWRAHLAREAEKPDERCDVAEKHKKNPFPLLCVHKLSSVFGMIFAAHIRARTSATDKAKGNTSISLK